MQDTHRPCHAETTCEFRRVAERLAKSKITLSDLKTMSAREKLLGKTLGKLDETRPRATAGRQEL